MWEKTTDLIDFARKELKTAIETNKMEVEIVLTSNFSKGTDEIQKYGEKFRIKTCTEILREEFNDYNIKSIVKVKGFLSAIVTYAKGPCTLNYPLVWCLTLQKK